MSYKADRFAVTRQRQRARIEDREWQQYQRKMIVRSK